MSLSRSLQRHLLLTAVLVVGLLSPSGARSQAQQQPQAQQQRQGQAQQEQQPQGQAQQDEGQPQQQSRQPPPQDGGPVQGGVRSNGDCPLIGLFPFSGNTDNLEQRTQQDTAERWYHTGYSYMATAVMAMNHFNERNGDIVPEVAALDPSCPVQFTSLDMLNTNDSYRDGVREYFNYVKDNEPPCAILGPLTSGGALRSQNLAAIDRVPQLLFGSYDDNLAKDKDTTIIGLLVESEARTKRLLEYLQWIGRDYLAVITSDKPELRSLADQARKLGKTYNMRVQSFEVKSKDGIESTVLRQKFDDASKSGIKTIYLSEKSSDTIADWATLLDEKNMLTNDYLYVIHHEAAYPYTVHTVFGGYEGSALDRMLEGAIIVDRLDNFREDDGDAFLKSWRAQNATMVDALNRKTPLKPDNDLYYQASPDFFQTVLPSEYSSYLYDAIMTAGVGACQYLALQKPKPAGNSNNEDEGDQIGSPNGNSSNNTNKDQGGQQPGEGNNGPSERRILQGDNPQPQGDNPPPPKKPSLVGTMREVVIQGSSGLVSFDKKFLNGSVRDGTQAPFGVFNVVRNKETNSYESIIIARSGGKNGSNNLEPIEGVFFHYKDGTTTPPAVTREILEPNYLSTWVRGTGLFLMSLVVLLALSCMTGIHYFKTTHCIRVGQPFFLMLLCFGSCVESLAILTISFDEGAGWTDGQLDAACISTPWLFFVGQVLTFAALFTKLMRVDRVLQFRRGQQITVASVSGPLVGLMAATLVILIVWTAVDPWTWVREVDEESLPLSSFGECTGDHVWVYFGLLMGLVVFAECVTLFYAMKTADMPEEYSDANSVKLAMAAQLQAWFVGLPVLVVLGNSSSEATYFGRVGLIWIFSFSSVALVVAPKIYRAITPLPDTADLSRVHVSGIASSNTSGNTGFRKSTNVRRSHGLFTTSTPAVVSRSSNEATVSKASTNDHNPKSDDLLCKSSGDLKPAGSFAECEESDAPIQKDDPFFTECCAEAADVPRSSQKRDSKSSDDLKSESCAIYPV